MNRLLMSMIIPISLIFFNAQAKAQNNPQKCPSVEYIKAVGVNKYPVQDSEGYWVTGRSNQTYDTPSKWTFLISQIPANTVNEAYSKALEALNFLTFGFGPIPGPVNKWVCMYYVPMGYQVVAFTPSVRSFLNKTL